MHRVLASVLIASALLAGHAHAAVPDAAAPAKPAVDPESLPGAAHYRTHCVGCHEGTTYKAPARTFIAMMSPDAIYAALTTG